jgi:hypothetical protein
MGTAVDEDETYEERWQVYRHDGKWWHLCIPYAEPHGPYDKKQQAIDDLRTYTLVDLYDEAAQNEPDDPEE